jgi:hypothetical protein
LTAEQATKFSTTLWNSVIPTNTLLSDYTQCADLYTTPLTSVKPPTQTPTLSSANKTAIALAKIVNITATPPALSSAQFTRPASTKTLLCNREEAARTQSTATPLRTEPAIETSRIYQVIAIHTKQELDRSLEQGYLACNTTNQAWVEAIQTDLTNPNQMRKALRNIRDHLSFNQDYSISDIVSRELRRTESWSRFQQNEVLYTANEGHRIDDIKRFRFIDPDAVVYTKSLEFLTISEQQCKENSTNSRNKHRDHDRQVVRGYLWQAQAGPNYDLYQGESE